MRELWDRLTYKPTFFSVLSILLILLSIPIGIYSYLNSDPSTEGWVLTFILFLFIGVGLIYSIDRLLVQKISAVKLSIAEFTFILICFLLLNYSSRQLFIDLSDSKENFVVIIENNGKLENSELNSISLFEKEIKTTNNLIIVRQMSKTNLKHKPDSWGDFHYYNKYSYDKYENVVLYSNPDVNMNDRISETFIDSLIKNIK